MTVGTFSSKRLMVAITFWQNAGENTHPIFKWLKSKLTGILFMDGIKWNFTKFLLDSYGQPVKRYGPMHEPKDIELDIIEELQKRKEMLKLILHKNEDKQKGEKTNEKESFTRSDPKGKVILDEL